MERNACLIFNPVAGQGDPDLDLATIESILSPAMDLEIVTTTAECEPGALAQAAIERGARAIIASGGDGTLSAVAAALMGTDIPLGIISRGTANAFANALNLPTTIEAACDAIVAGDTKVVDIACCNGQPMVLLVGIGFEAETIEAADREAKNRLGMMAYILAGLQQLRNLQQFEATIEVEDKIITVSASGLVVANAAPATSILAQGSAGVVYDDGLLDLTILSPASPLSALATGFDLLASTLGGRASTRDDVGFLRSHRFKISAEPPQKVAIDGEVVGTTPIEVECIPGGLTVFAPTTAAEQPIEKLEGLPNLQIESKV